LIGQFLIKIKKENIMKLIPDWQNPRSLVLVWPEKLRNRDKLIPFYKEFIRLLPSGLELTLILKNKEFEKRISSELNKINPEISIKYHEIPHVEDIWIRDWAPFLCADELENTVAAKMLYNPSYYKKYEKIFAEHDNQAGYDIANYLGYELIDFPVIWDGGNITFNGKGTAFFTKQLITDNPQFSSKNNLRKLLSKIGITKFYTTDVEPGDKTGHIDGMVRFKDEKTLLIGAYPEEYYIGDKLITEKELTESRKFMNKVAEQFEGIFNVIR